MKKRYIVLGVFVAAIAGGVYYINQNLEPIVKKLVNQYGSQITGTNVSLDGFKLSLMQGSMSLQGLKVGNPQGYQEPNILSIGEASVKLNIGSLRTSIIEVESINIKAPEVSYEIKDITRNNVQDLLKNIEKNTAATAKAESKPAQTDMKTDSAKTESTEPSKKVVIDKLSVTDGKINLGASLGKQGASASIPLPSIELKDIGRENGKQGQSITETAVAILNKIFTTAYDTVIKQGGEALKQIANEGEKALKGVAEDLKTETKDLLKNLF